MTVPAAADNSRSSNNEDDTNVTAADSDAVYAQPG